ncbi:hypothetical protein TAM4_1174 [Thermococcus sp. AM4]|nr:hypothetical protein TAM4_1174 [Thermococcus sp. AM4]
MPTSRDTSGFQFSSSLIATRREIFEARRSYQTFNSPRVLLQLICVVDIQIYRYLLSILLESYCNTKTIKSLAEGGSLSILLESYCNGALREIEMLSPSFFQFSSSLIATDKIPAEIAHYFELSILLESYCNKNNPTPYRAHRILSILLESYCNLQLSSDLVALLLLKTFNSPRVLLQRMWEPCKKEAKRFFQFSSSLIATLKVNACNEYALSFQFSSSLIATLTEWIADFLGVTPFNSPRVLLQLSTSGF